VRAHERYAASETQALGRCRQDESPRHGATAELRVAAAGHVRIELPDEVEYCASHEEVRCRPEAMLLNPRPLVHVQRCVNDGRPPRSLSKLHLYMSGDEIRATSGEGVETAFEPRGFRHAVSVGEREDRRSGYRNAEVASPVTASSRGTPDDFGETVRPYRSFRAVGRCIVDDHHLDGISGQGLTSERIQEPPHLLRPVANGDHDGYEGWLARLAITRRVGVSSHWNRVRRLVVVGWPYPSLPRRRPATTGIGRLP